MERKIKNIWVPILLPMAFLLSCITAPSSLEEQLNRDNTKFITFLQSLDVDMIGRPLRGISLSYGDLHLKDSIYLGSKLIKSKGQHIYLFRVTNRTENVTQNLGLRGYAWVDSDGLPLKIPYSPRDRSPENAYVLSGDVYTWKTIQPSHGVVMLTGATKKWLDEI